GANPTLVDDSDDDDSGSGSARSDGAPRYYFRPHRQRSRGSSGDASDAEPRHGAQPPGVGNLAVICRVAGAADLDLARRFVLAAGGGGNDAAAEACRHNAEVAAEAGRAGLAHTWAALRSLLAQNGARVWAEHAPIARWLRSVAVQYRALGDVQTLALVAGVVSQAIAQTPKAGSGPSSVAMTVRDVILRHNGKAEAEVPDQAAMDRIIDGVLADALGDTPVDATLGCRLVGDASSAKLRRLRVFMAAFPGVLVFETPPLLAGTMWAPSATKPDLLLDEMDEDEVKSCQALMAIAKPADEAGQEEEEKPREMPDRLKKDRRQHRPTSGSSSPPDSADNLWHRLRTNVLGRVNTVGGYTTTADPTPPPPPSSSPPPPPVSASPPPAAAVTTAIGSSSSSSNLALPSKSAQPSLDIENTYLSLYEKHSRPRTRLVIHHKEEEEKPQLLLAQPSQDHWKLIYARI
ncbi:hypothetical protein IWW38_005420, partial [Coemansia aciculifera]